MIRLLDPEECKEVTDKHLDYFTFDAVSWFENPDNYALKEDDNIAFAEYIKDGVYQVHFCFRSARGRQAIVLTEEIFKEFCKVRDVKTVLGFIHVDNKRAVWVVRKAGFTFLDKILTPNGLCEIFYKVNN